MTEKNSRFEKFRPYIQLGITALVELFTEAVAANVMSHVEGGKMTKFGAKIGAGLVGLMIGDQVSDYVCDSLDEFMDGLEEVKESIESAKEEG